MTTRTLFIVCFFISGVAGLTYQVAWIRMLSLVFGNTTYAVSMVVAAFLAGLAIGSHYWGKTIDHPGRNPYKTYLNLEIGIAVSAVAVTVLIKLLDDAIVGFMTVDSIAQGHWQAIRFALLFVLLLAPTALMGGTTPVMGKLYVKNAADVGRGIGSLYAANTYGAMVGCFLTGFLFVPFLGVRGAVQTAIFLNLLVVVLLLVVGKTRDAEPARETKGTNGVTVVAAPKKKDKKKKKKREAFHEVPKPAEEGPGYRVSLGLALALIGLSGFGSLAFEILWTRAFIVSFKSTVYLFSNLLTVVLFGMALGAHLSSRWLDGLKDPMKLFGLAQVGVGVLGLFSIVFFAVAGDVAVSISGMFGRMNWQKDVVVTFIVMLFAFSLSTVLMGVSYPLICRVVTRTLETLGKNVGVVYAVGTVGGILGSLMAAFFMLPLLGLQSGIFAISLLSLLTGYLALYHASSRRTLGVALPISAIVALALFIGLQISGTDIGIGETPQGKMVYTKEGVMGTVKVAEEWENGPRTLMVNNYQLATSGDVAVRFGHIPLLLKPDAEEVLVISLGSGITSGSVGGHPVKRIECVEIVPTLVDVQHLFSNYNHDIIKDSRFHLTLWDGGHYLRVTDRKYDLVISDLFQPDSAGVGSLYSLEHFLAAKRALKKGGAMAQWLPLYQLSPDNLRVIMRTFAEAFQYVTVWSGDINSELPTLMLLGSVDPLYIHPKRLVEKFELEAVRRDMIEFADPLSFLSFFIMDRDGTLKFAEDAEINTDNNPVIEYTAPRHIWERRENAVANFASLIKERKKVTPLMPGSEDDPDLIKGIDRYFKARTHIMAGKVAHAQRNYSEELKQYQEAVELTPHEPYLSMAAFDLGYFYYGRADYQQSAELFKWARQINPDLLEAYFYLAKSYQNIGDKEAAMEAFRELARKKPEIAEQLISK